MIEQLKNRFRDFEQELNGDGRGVWHQLRSEALDSFNKKGFPSARDEEYKYTHIGRLIEKNIDFSKIGTFGSAVSVLSTKPLLHDADAIHIFITNGIVDKDQLNSLNIPGLITISLKEAARKYPDDLISHLGKNVNSEKDPFAALNTAFSYEGVFVKIVKNTRLDKPLVLHYTYDSNAPSATFQSRNLILAESGSKANIIESFSTNGDIQFFANHVSEVFVGSNAFLNYYKLQNQGVSAYHVDNTSISQQRDSNVQTFTISLEGKIIRNNLNFNLDDENSEAHMYGLYVAHGETHIDNHTSVDHRFPNCFSNEIYKGILDHNSKGVFNGKIFVRQDAQKTNAFQSNKNILLSDTANINTKPQLEIWADDVKCSHGCTTGQLDDEQLFYLQSRGISKSKAKAMLLHAFVNDVIDKIEVDFLRDFINDEMYNRLD